MREDLTGRSREAFVGLAREGKGIRVLYVDTHECTNCRDERAGVRRFARLAGWNCLFERAEDLPALRAAVDRCRPGGLIVECSLRPNGYPSRAFGSLPVVYLDCRPGARAGRISAVTHDSESTGRRGAMELLKFHLQRYAYVGYNYRAYWSAARERGFLREMEGLGFKTTVFRGLRQNLGLESIRPSLANWCRSLRPQTGIMAANDEIGAMLLEILRGLGYGVPKDIVVIGVDNNEDICALTPPPLTSLKADFERAGFLAAETLEDLMAGRAKNPSFRQFSALGIVHRRSTGDCGRSSPVVVRAASLIRERATQGLSVREVVASMGMGARLAEMRFRTMTGRSIQDEIMLTRFEQVFQMLRRGPISHAALADACGFRSADTLRREFRRRTGISISDWCRK